MFMLGDPPIFKAVQTGFEFASCRLCFSTRAHLSFVAQLKWLRKLALLNVLGNSWPLVHPVGKCVRWFRPVEWKLVSVWKIRPGRIHPGRTGLKSLYIPWMLFIIESLFSEVVLTRRVYFELFSGNLWPDHASCWELLLCLAKVLLFPLISSDFCFKFQYIWFDILGLIVC